MANNSTIRQCQLIDLNGLGEFVQMTCGVTIPFKVKRVYYLYDVPGNQVRGGHAHKQLFQLIIAASGKFEITLDDGKKEKTFALSSPDHGLLVVPGIWRELKKFSEDGVCLVLASMDYSEEDYIRDYSHFQEYKSECPSDHL